MSAVSKIADVQILKMEKTGEAPTRPWLFLYRLTLQSRFSDGEVSRPYAWDAVMRKGLDAVAIILRAEVDNKECLLLRTAVRPPLLLRETATLPVRDNRRPICLWELPAGIIEEGDTGEEGILSRAAIETLEETGYDLPVTSFSIAGTAPFISPGVIPERLFYATARVLEPHMRGEPGGDGSAVEEGACVSWVPLDRVLAMCEDGTIEDMKTELGIRRILSMK